MTMPTAGSRLMLRVGCWRVLTAAGIEPPEIARSAFRAFLSLASYHNGEYAQQRARHRGVTPLVTRDEIAEGELTSSSG